jgi:TRAP transporter TAXI family solute receptor
MGAIAQRVLRCYQTLSDKVGLPDKTPRDRASRLTSRHLWEEYVTRLARRPALAFATAAILAAYGASPSAAQDLKLPSTLTLTAYDTGSSGFNIAVADGKMFKDKHGTDVRVLPAGNDVARLTPLKLGRAQASAMGIGTYFAQEGVFEFAVKEWGPQSLRLMLSSTDCNAISLGVAKDTGVKEIKDLKGKRIGIVVGSPALNQNAYAVLAFGNLTKNDVKLVEFSSYGAMWKGMLNNEADAAIASNISGQVKEVETSPRGIIYPPTPVADKEGWARLHKIGPYFLPHKTTCGVSVPPGGSVELPSYAYPIFMTYAEQPADAVYALTKSMVLNYDAYKDGAPGAAGLDVKRQNFSWVVPYHEGAVKALKEAGAWTADAEAHNQKLLKRQAALASAWTAYLKSNPPEDKDAFAKAWMAARKTALTAVGMDAIFE